MSPIYQPPISYVQTYDSDNGGTERSRLVSEETEIAVNVLVLEVIAVLIVGGGLYMLTSDSSDEWGSASD